MITAETGEIKKVVGRSKEMVAIGPIPGRTPTKLPKNTPTKQ
jgi:hypothetical protein